MQTEFIYDYASRFVPLAYRFTGKERDVESGNDYFGARYYASNMGRFMSADRSDGPDSIPYAKLSSPQTLNLYAYVQNNPLKYTDPDGHEGIVNADGSMKDGTAGGESCADVVHNNAAHPVVSAKVTAMDDGHVNDLSGGELLMAVPVDKFLAPVLGPVLGRLGEALTSLFGKEAGKAATEVLTAPTYANTPGGFVSWLRNLSRDGTQLASSQMDAIVAQAKQLGVDTRLNPPDPGLYESPHINFGKEGQVHLEVPRGYDNPTIPKGSARGRE